MLHRSLNIGFGNETPRWYHNNSDTCNRWWNSALVWWNRTCGLGPHFKSN